MLAQDTARSTYYQIAALAGVELLAARQHTNPFPWHAHEGFTLTLVLAGTESLRLPTQQLYTPAGSFSLTHPQEVHATPVLSSAGYCFQTFYLRPELLREVAGGTLPYFAQQVIHHPALFARFHQAAQLLAQASPLFASSLRDALRDLLRQYSQPDERATSVVPAQVQAIQQALAYHLSAPPPLAQLARQVGWSRFQLVRHFKQATGLTPSGYLLLRRLELARHLLAQGCPLAQTALEAGFYDQAHLTRFFRRMLGISPGRYQASVWRGA